MSTHRFDEDIQDNDPTDELPVLTDVILGEDIEATASIPGPAADADDTGRFQAVHTEATPASDTHTEAAARLQQDLDDRNERLSTLEAELARLQHRWSDTEAALSARDEELSRLHAELTDRETAIADQRAALEESSDELRAQKNTIAELTTALESERDRAAQLERNSEVLEQQIKGLEQKITEMETEHAVARESSKPVTDEATMTRLREEVAALSQHIENRNVIWHDQTEKVAEQSTRIRELEIEVAQRLERQLEAERLAETEAASARAAREKLGEALEKLKRSRPEDAQTARPRPRDADDEVADEDRAARLRRELAQTVLVQANQRDDAEALSRLAELEAAIMSLEEQMEAKRDEPGVVSAPEPPAPPEPARLICLTEADTTEYALDQPSITIGRGATCDIRIGTHYVSREHARVTVTDAGCRIEDLGSRNGVFVNAVKVERHDLAADDLITVGDTQFRFQAGGSG